MYGVYSAENRAILVFPFGDFFKSNIKQSHYRGVAAVLRFIDVLSVRITMRFTELDTESLIIFIVEGRGS